MFVLLFVCRETGKCGEVSRGVCHLEHAVFLADFDLF